MEIILILMVLAIFGAAALLWGADSTPGVNDPEWERRRQWQSTGR
jgi:hypothetical protein